MAWERDDKDYAYDFDYGNAHGVESPCLGKKLEVKNLHLKIKLKQELKQEKENGLLVSKKCGFLKYEIKRRPLFQ